MIYSKQNLQIVEITKTDKDIPVLDNVLFEPDGSSVASNGMAVVCVSPVPAAVKKNFPIFCTPATHPAVISSETIKEVLRGVPRDTKFKGVLENVELSTGSDRAKFTLTDGKRKKEIGAKTYPYPYANYRATVSRLYAARKESDSRVVVHLDRFLAVLSVLARMVDKEAPIYLEFTKEDDIIIRGEVAQTGQQILSIFKSYKMISADDWPELSNWEKQLLSNKGTGAGGNLNIEGNKKVLRKVAKVKKAPHPVEEKKKITRTKRV